MDIGVGSWRSFRYVPECGGNRELPDAEQVSVEIVRPSAAQRLAQQEVTEASLKAWRDTALAPWMDDEEFADSIPLLSSTVLLVLRTVVQHTRDWRGLTCDGRPLTDPLEICLRAPIPVSAERPLVREVYDVIQQAAGLTGEQLGNFVRQCAGSSSGTTPPPTDGGTAADPAGQETAGSAIIPEAPTA